MGGVKKPKKTHGGRRKGAGRKASIGGGSGTAARFSVSVGAELLAALDELAQELGQPRAEAARVALERGLGIEAT